MSGPTIRDRAAIVGIGQTAFSRGLGRSEYDMALEAILAACEVLKSAGYTFVTMAEAAARF